MSPSKKPLSPQGAALLAWLHNVDQTATGKSTAPLTIESLADGHKLWAILKRAEPEVFKGELPEMPSSSGKWVSRLQNLKHLLKPLQQVFVERRGAIAPTWGVPDLKAFAAGESPAAHEAVKAYLRSRIPSHNPNANISMQLLKMVLYVIVNGENNMGYIQAIMSMQPEQQKHIQEAILEASLQATATSHGPSTDAPQASQTTGATAVSHDPSNAPEVVADADKDLYYEQQLSQMVAENSRLAKERKDLAGDVQDLNAWNERLQQHNGVLQEKLATAEDRVKHATASANAQGVVRELETRVARQDDLIADYEAQLAGLAGKAEGLEAEAARLRREAGRLQPLQDQYDEVKVERDALARKANAMEKYKQKLQAVADLEKEVTYLRNALDESRQLARQGDDSGRRTVELERALTEYQNLIPTLERQLMDAEGVKQRLKRDAAEAQQRYEDERERANKYQETADELMHRAEGENGALGALDSELNRDGAKLDDSMFVSRPPSVAATTLAEAEANKQRADDLESRNKKLTLALEQQTFQKKMTQDLLDEQRKKTEGAEKLYSEMYRMLRKVQDARQEEREAKGEPPSDRESVPSRPKSRAGKKRTANAAAGSSRETVAPVNAANRDAAIAKLDEEVVELARLLRAARRDVKRYDDTVRRVMGIERLGHASAADEDRLRHAIDALLASAERGEAGAARPTRERDTERFVRDITQSMQQVSGHLDSADTVGPAPPPGPARGLARGSASHAVSIHGPTQSDFAGALPPGLLPPMEVASSVPEQPPFPLAQPLPQASAPGTRLAGPLPAPDARRPSTASSKKSTTSAKKAAGGIGRWFKGIMGKPSKSAGAVANTRQPGQPAPQPSPNQPAEPSPHSVPLPETPPVAHPAHPQPSPTRPLHPPLQAGAQRIPQQAAGVSKQEWENVKRENRLMATAWLDLSSRLQMNHVALQRRGDAPRSWLGRARLEVHQTPAARNR